MYAAYRHGRLTLSSNSSCLLSRVVYRSNYKSTAKNYYIYFSSSFYTGQDNIAVREPFYEAIPPLRQLPPIIYRVVCNYRVQNRKLSPLDFIATPFFYIKSHILICVVVFFFSRDVGFGMQIEILCSDTTLNCILFFLFFLFKYFFIWKGELCGCETHLFVASGDALGHGRTLSTDCFLCKTARAFQQEYTALLLCVISL